MVFETVETLGPEIVGDEPHETKRIPAERIATEKRFFMEKMSKRFSHHKEKDV